MHTENIFEIHPIKEHLIALFSTLFTSLPIQYNLARIVVVLFVQVLVCDSSIDSL